MKHGFKMKTVISKSLNDRLKIVTVSALMTGAFLCIPFASYAESPSPEGIEQTARNILVKGIVLDANGEPVIGASVKLKSAAGIGTITDMMVSSPYLFLLMECCRYLILDTKRLKQKWTDKPG